MLNLELLRYFQLCETESKQNRKLVLWLSRVYEMVVQKNQFLHLEVIKEVGRGLYFFYNKLDRMETFV